MKFQIGTKLTLYSVSPFMACTQKLELEITGEKDNRPTFKKRGFCREYFLPELIESSLLFEGWDLPLKLDSEVKVKDGILTKSLFRGNACLNLVAPIEVIAQYVTNRNLNDLFTREDAVIQIDGDKEIPVFPNAPSQSAVVDRIRSHVLISTEAILL